MFQFQVRSREVVEMLSYCKKVEGGKGRNKGKRKEKGNEMLMLT